MKFFLICLLFLLMFVRIKVSAQGILVDHHSAKLAPIPVWALQRASDSLHIAFGHSAYGSQLITGMTGLENQDTGLKGYKGDYYCWNHYQYPGEEGPCIEIHDQFRPGNLGQFGNTQWAGYTREYLDNDTVSTNINVIIWSWEDGCSNNTVEGINTYLNTMNQLEIDYPDVQFVYMTGHLDVWDRDTLKRNNRLIRDYCVNNNKVLYDFADIESYNPDGLYFEYATDNCNYYDEDGNKLGNWAEEWQFSHELGVDWFYCLAAHSKPLNGNMKSYAAWWLWSRLAGWDGIVGVNSPSNAQSFHVYYHNNTIVIKSPEQSDATIYNQIGEKILSKDISKGENRFTVRLVKGIYFVNLRYRDGSTNTHKIYLP